MKFALAFILFLAAVIVLVPFVLRGDGTQRGMVQIALAYSMSVLNIILSFLVIFLSTTLFCAELKDKTIFTLDTKPVRRWQILVGKWLGIMILNAAILAVLGAAVYGMVRYMGREGISDEHDYLLLRREVLTARAEASVSGEIEPGRDDFVVPYNSEQLWIFEGVRPGAGVEYVTVRFRQYSAVAGEEDLQLPGVWLLGDIDGDYYARQFVFPEGETNEFRVPVEVIGEGGRLYARWRNLSPVQASVIFPRDNIRVLYTAGTFGANFFRALLLIFVRLAFIAAVGLAASTFLTFPVATLLTLFVLVLSLSMPTLVSIFLPSPAAPGAEEAARQDGLGGLVLRRGIVYLLQILPNLRGYDPVPWLVDGRLLGWGRVLRAFLTVFILRSGFAALIGVLVFNRRELAHMGYD